MDVLTKISYGLYVLSSKFEGKDSGCIINTACQVALEPEQVSVCISKQNYTHEIIQKSGEFNVSMLTVDAPFDVFKHFGFASSRDVNKFDGTFQVERAENGIYYLNQFTNGFVSVKVTKTIDLGSHTQFIGEPTEKKVLSEVPSVTYQYYFDHIKPAPAPVKEEKKGWVCRICGYVYEGEELPKDYICPLCKHGAEDFEPLK